MSLHALQRRNTLAASVSPPESPCSLVVVTPELPLDPSDQGERATVTKGTKPFLLVNACVDDAMQLHLPPCPPSPPFLPTDSTRLLYYLLRFRHPASALMLRPSCKYPRSLLTRTLSRLLVRIWLLSSCLSLTRVWNLL